MKFIHTFEGDAPTGAEIARLEQAAHKLALGMTPGTTRRSFEIVGGAAAYLMAGTPGIVHIHTIKDSKTEQPRATTEDQPDTGYLRTPPDFVSGFVYGEGRYHTFRDEESGCMIPALSVPPTVHTEHVSEEFAARKLCVANARTYAIAEYTPLDTETLTFSQVAKKRPGYFTGLMAPVVQMMLGAGRFLAPSVYEQTSQHGGAPNVVSGMQSAYNPKTQRLDEPLEASCFKYTKILTEGDCSGAEQSQDPFGMEVPWDYRWHRTHGIMLGTDETALGGHRQTGFVIDISAAGVYAYPLEVDPLTVYARVQDYMKRVYPWMDEPSFAGNNVFAAFGGIPRPTYFALGSLAKAVEQGAVVRMCDANEFYNGEHICTTFGWAFSETTGEAVNITSRFDGTDDMKANHMYKLQVRGLRVVMEAGSDGKKKRTVKGSATLIPIRSGNVYSPFKPPSKDPCRPTGAPQFQFYEPLINDVVSYDMHYGRRPTGRERCDAPIFCCYIKDDVHILNYVYPGESPKTNKNEATREPCQVTGSWTTTTETESYTAGHFYNSTTDLRKQVSGSYSKEVRKEWPAYDHTVHAQVNFFSCAITSTHKHYNHFTAEFERHSGTGYAAAVGVSSTDRSVYFVCTLDLKRNGGKGKSGGIVYAGDGPIVRHTAMYYFISHWTGGAGLSPTIGCMEPTDEFVETVESCFSSDTESLVGKVKHYSLDANGNENCTYYANQATGGFYSGSGTLGLWMSIGYSGDANKDKYPEPFEDVNILTEQHEATKRVYIFGAPLANGRMIAEYTQTAKPEEEPFGLEFAGDWFRFSVPRECPATPMPVCRNFLGKDFMATYNDRSHAHVVEIGESTGLGPLAIPVGGITK